MTPPKLLAETLLPNLQVPNVILIFLSPSFRESPLVVLLQLESSLYCKPLNMTSKIIKIPRTISRPHSQKMINFSINDVILGEKGKGYKT